MANKPIQFKVPSRPKDPPPYDFPNGFAGGVNYSVTPDLVRPNQSPDMLNMNYDDGAVPTKRIGVQRATATAWGLTPVRGMYEYWKKDAATPVFLVVYGGKVYSYDPAADTRTDLCTGSKATVADKPMHWFTMNDRAYGYNGTDYIVYDGVNPVADVIGYVPLLMTDKAPDGTGGAANEDLNRLSNSWREGFKGTETATEYVLTLEADSVTVKVDGEEVPAGNYTFPTGGTDYSKVTFGVAPGVKDIEITATKAGLNNFDDIRKCSMFQVWGGKTDTRVFAAGNPNIKNARFPSGLSDPTYWPAPVWPYYNGDRVTSDAEGITGLGRLVDYQIIGKERSFHYSYIQGPDEKGTISFPILPFNDEYGCLAGRTMAPVQGGLVCLVADNEGNPAGVGWIVPSLVRGQMNVKIISQDINRAQAPLKGLLDYSLAELKAAHAIIHDTKYYLFVGDKTWILDLKYSDLSQWIYCWYPYDTAYSHAACFIARHTGELWLGDSEQGLIYKPRPEEQKDTCQDDSIAYRSYWQAPLLFLGMRDRIKEFQYLRLSFAGQPDGNHLLTIITDTGDEPVNLVYQEERALDLNDIDFNDWTFGFNFYPYPQTERVGYRSVYLSWRIENSQPGERMTILAQSLQYRYGELTR